MPSRNKHLEFDNILCGQGIIPEGLNTSTVHKFMDEGASIWGADHREIDPNHKPDAIREFIDFMVATLGTIKPETSTGYVRCAWGHLVLDLVVSAEKDWLREKFGREPRVSEIDWEEMYHSALKMFYKHGLERKRYRRPNHLL